MTVAWEVSITDKVRSVSAYTFALENENRPAVGPPIEYVFILYELALIVPAISSFCHGFAVPIPTFPPVNARFPPDRAHRALRSSIFVTIVFQAVAVRDCPEVAGVIVVYAAYPTLRIQSVKMNDPKNIPSFLGRNEDFVIELRIKNREI